MLSTGKVLAKILKYINALASTTGIFTTTEHTCNSQTQAKATQTSYRQSFTKAGYYPLGIVGWYMEGTGVGQLVPYMMRVETAANGSASVNYGIRNNNSNTDITVKLHIMILWKKVGGVLHSSIFKAFSHLQEIGGGVNAICKKTDSQSPTVFNCKERKYKTKLQRWGYKCVLLQARQCSELHINSRLEKSTCRLQREHRNYPGGIQACTTRTAKRGNPRKENPVSICKWKNRRIQLRLTSNGGEWTIPMLLHNTGLDTSISERGWAVC